MSDGRAGEGGGELPGLVASPVLAELLANVEAADRANARATALLADVFESGEVEQVTGVAVETWLLAAGATASDRRMLATAAVQLRRLPSVRDGFDRGLVSWAQVRALCLLAERLADAHAAALDLTLAPSIVGYAGADPDGLVAIGRQAVERLLTGEVADDTARSEREPFVHFQPRLDGSGAKVYGDLDGLGYGLVAAALDAGAPLPGRRRDLIGQPPDGGVAGEATRRLGRWRAGRLVQLCADELARHGQPLDPSRPLVGDVPDGDGAVTDRGAGGGTLERTRALAPEALLVLTCDQLLGDDRLPVELVTKVTGGRLRVAAPTARSWIDQAGARLRTVVLDDTGQVLGVGARTRVPPGWLRDAQLAVHATCAGPGCRTAAAACDLDHHTPVHPHRPGDPTGRTDVDNLGPLCRSDNSDKERQGWQVRQHHDGTLAWHHPRSGLTTRTIPWSVRAAAARPPDRRPDRAPPHRRASPPDQRPDRAPPDRAPPDRAPPDRRGSPPQPNLPPSADPDLPF